MRSSAKVIFMLLTLALTLPAVVHAQSAGDDQYVDPFAGAGGRLPRVRGVQADQVAADLDDLGGRVVAALLLC